MEVDNCCDLVGGCTGPDLLRGEQPASVVGHDTNLYVDHDYHAHDCDQDKAL